VAVSPDGRTAYVADESNCVAVVSTATNTVTDTIPVGSGPVAVAVSPDGGTAYVASYGASNVSVISTATNTVTATIFASDPIAMAVSPDGGSAYVANYSTGDVWVISTATNTATAAIPVGNGPVAVAATDVPPAAPAVTGISPSSGPQAGGTSVTITGTGLAGATAVHFGTIAATGFTVNSATQVTATAPAAASPGTVRVTVTTPGGTSAASQASQYTYRLTPDRADVSAALSCPAAITTGRHATCTLAVANAGPATAAVTATILLPPNLTATACTPRCTGDSSTATWTLPALASGATTALTVTVRACAPGSATVLAEATTPTPDPDPDNNSATARVTITRHHQH
jgi:YVTN family beta-propeller protein